MTLPWKRFPESFVLASWRAPGHIDRVKARVKRGGHDIGEDKIRERYVRSLENLIGLVRELDELKLFDNSHTVDIAAGEAPGMRALLHYRGGRIVDRTDPRSMPDWAKPVVMAVLRAIGSPNRRHTP